MTTAPKLVLAGLLLTALPAAAADFTVRMEVVDPAIAGDVKMVGDIDGDGRPDLVVGGSKDDKLNWYRNPTWRKTVILAPMTEFTTDGALGDVDGDGDIDIVIFDGEGAKNLHWYENPRPNNSPMAGFRWRRHVVGGTGSWGKDVELGDFDRDGRLDIAVRSADTLFIFFQETGDRWTRRALPARRLGSEGLASGDIDGDGNIDLVLDGAWLRNPGRGRARDPLAWSEQEIGPAYGTFKAVVADFDGDGRPDVAYSSSEGTADVAWYGQGADGRWTRHVVLAAVERAHTLQAADMDGDGDIDLVIGQMHTSDEKKILLAENLNGRGAEWTIHVIGTGGLHNGVVADLNGDGRPDLFGANYTGTPPVRVWLNLPPGERQPQE